MPSPLHYKAGGAFSPSWLTKCIWSYLFLLQNVLEISNTHVILSRETNSREGIYGEEKSQQISGGVV